METNKKKIVTRIIIGLFIAVFTFTSVPATTLVFASKRSSASYSGTSRRSRKRASSKKTSSATINIKNPYSLKPISLLNFNAEQYAIDNPDVAQAFGLDKNALYLHYVNYGFSEGRTVHSINPTEDQNYQIARRILLDSLDPNHIISYNNFNYSQYAADYPDVVAAVGSSRDALFNHYVYYGVNEGRAAHSLDPKEEKNLIAVGIAKQVAGAITNSSMSAREKVQVCHDWIVNSTSYDYANYLAGTIPMDSYTPYGVFINHVAVCGGYSASFKLLMDIVGVPCVTVSGNAYNGVVTGRHAWNRVFIDGVWLFIDVTWDDPVNSDGSQTLRYDYFLIDEGTMNRNHYPE